MGNSQKKKNRGSNWTNADNGVVVSGDDKRQILQTVMARSALFNPKIGRPFKFEPAEIEERAKAYFLDCVERATHPTLTGLAVALDVCYDTLTDWANDRNKPFHNIIQRAKMLIRDFEEQSALEGKTNLILHIFRSKAIWGLVERSAIDISSNAVRDPLTDGLPSADEIRERHKLLDSFIDDDTSLLPD